MLPPCSCPPALPPFAQVRQLQPQAVAAWWQQGHPGWAIYPVDSEQFLATGTLDSAALPMPTEPLYEQYADPAFVRTPLATDLVGLYAVSGVSFGAHESQSRLFENHVGRSREFCCIDFNWRLFRQSSVQ